MNKGFIFAVLMHSEPGSLLVFKHGFIVLTLHLVFIF